MGKHYFEAKTINLEKEIKRKDKKIKKLKNEIIDLKGRLGDCHKQLDPEDESKLRPWSGWGETLY